MDNNTIKTTRDKLSVKAEIIIRMLYLGFPSKDLPPDVFNEREKEHLIALKLITLSTQGWILTKKAITAIETGGFIVKYPLTTEKGVVLNFIEVLNSYSKDAAKALGLSVLNTRIYERWGKDINNTLYDVMKNTQDYYASHMAVSTRMDTYLDRVRAAQSDYEKLLDTELDKIEQFKLLKPIKLGLNGTGNVMLLTEYISPKEGILGNTGLKLPVPLDDPKYALTTYMKHELISQYYVHKSRKNQQRNFNGKKNPPNMPS